MEHRWEFQDHVNAFCERHNDELDGNKFINRDKCLDYVMGITEGADDAARTKMLNRITDEEIAEHDKH